METSIIGVNDGPCSYLTFPLYTRMFLREALPTGEPTSMPSGEPTSVPTSEPTVIPTNVPSADPSGPPTVGPTVQPSADPSSCPSAEPSVQPSGEPSGAPSTLPSAQPTVQPSSHPTLVSLVNSDHVFFRGGDDLHPAIFPLVSLGYANRTVRPMYLSVDIRATNFEVRGEQWAMVKLNDNVINAACTPDVSCVDMWYTCVSWLEVSDELSSVAGGSMTVEVSSTGVSSGPCDYLGYPLYARVFLTELSPPDPQYEALSIWAIIGPAVFGLLSLVVAAWHLHLYIRTRRMNEKYGVESARRSEAVQQPDDLEADPEANDVHTVPKPLSSAQSSPRAFSLGDSKVVPVENSEHDMQLVDRSHSDAAEDDESVDGLGMKSDIESVRDSQILSKEGWLINYELEELELDS